MPYLSSINSQLARGENLGNGVGGIDRILTRGGSNSSDDLCQDASYSPNPQNSQQSLS